MLAQSNQVTERNFDVSITFSIKVFVILQRKSKTNSHPNFDAHVQLTPTYRKLAIFHKFRSKLILC